MVKWGLSERCLCTKFVTPSSQQAGWERHQFRKEVSLTEVWVMVRRELAARIRNPPGNDALEQADHVLYAQPGLPIAITDENKRDFWWATKCCKH